RADGEEEAVAIVPVLGPLLVSAKVLDAGLDFDNPDVALLGQCNDVGAAPVRQWQLGNAGETEAGQYASNASRDVQGGWRLTSVMKRRSVSTERRRHALAI